MTYETILENHFGKRREGFFEETIKPLVPTGSTIVEVGVQYGVFSEFLSNCFEPSEFYGVDQYLKSGPTYTDRPGVYWADENPLSLEEAHNDYHYETDEGMDELYNKTLAKYEAFGGNLIRKESSDAAEDFEDESIDLIYIDGDHTYEKIFADIKNWWPKVKVGGIMSGDDYCNPPETVVRWPWGVVKAVDEWCARYGQTLQLWETQWYIVKK